MMDLNSSLLSYLNPRTAQRKSSVSLGVLPRARKPMRKILAA
jgi:hypothetical protein